MSRIGIIFDLFMTIITGGLWLVWMFIRHVNKKA